MKAPPDSAAGLLEITAISVGAGYGSEPGGWIGCRRSAGCGRRPIRPIDARNNDRGETALASLRSEPADGWLGAASRVKLSCVLAEPGTANFVPWTDPLSVVIGRFHADEFLCNRSILGKRVRKRVL